MIRLEKAQELGYGVEGRQFPQHTVRAGLIRLKNAMKNMWLPTISIYAPVLAIARNSPS